MDQTRGEGLRLVEELDPELADDAPANAGEWQRKPRVAAGWTFVRVAMC